MTLWSCASCGLTTLCEHRELAAVEIAIALAERLAALGDGELPDPLPPRKPAASETLTRKAANQ